MKKIKYLIIMFAMIFTLTGCAEKNIEGSLSEVMDKIYANISEENKPMSLINMEINDENIEGFIGTKNVKYKEALASEPEIGSIAHSVVILRLESSKDAKKVKEDILENVNPRKWLCVGVEKEDVVVDNIGDLVVLIMIENETTRNLVIDNFNNLKKGN